MNFSASNATDSLEIQLYKERISRLETELRYKNLEDILKNNQKREIEMELLNKKMSDTQTLMQQIFRGIYCQTSADQSEQNDHHVDPTVIIEDTYYMLRKDDHEYKIQNLEKQVDKLIIHSLENEKTITLLNERLIESNMEVNRLWLKINKSVTF